jgi:hypothetical protein
MTSVIRKLGVKRLPERSKISFIDYSQFTSDNIASVFLRAKWHDVLLHKSVHDMLESFNSIYLSFLSQLIQVRTRFVKSAQLPDWLDDVLRSHMKERDRLKHQGDWISYKQKRNFVTNLIRERKKHCIQDQIRRSKHGDTTAIWRLLNVKSSKGKQIVSDLSPDELNAFFTSVANKNCPKTSSCNLSLINTSSSFKLDFIPRFTPYLCSKLLSSISNKKSSGPDGISVRMLKLTFPYICNIVTDMLNRILIDGTFPNCWKIAKVTPILKSGSHEDPSNFRPISILPILSKIFEMHVNKCLQLYLSNTNQLHPLQFGFRKGHACGDAVRSIISHCINQRKQRISTVMMFLDFSKAFDCVDHDILISKLSSMGLKGSVLALLCSFLSDRKQFVNFGGHNSTVLPISTGVPQGSILAPTLFLVYINDLLKQPTINSAYAYADDTVFIRSDRNITKLRDECNQDLQHILTWCKSNNMKINLRKSHYLLVCAPSSDCTSFKLMIGNDIISKVHNTKLLGFHISDDLTWNKHVDHVCNKIASNLFLLKQCRGFIDRSTALSFYYQFIHCHLIYGIDVYFPSSSDSLTNRIFLLQKSSMRTVFSNSNIPARFMSTDVISKSLNLLPYPKLATYFICIYGFKVLHKLCPPCLFQSFSSNAHRFSLRDTNIIHAPNSMYEVFIASSFNSLPRRLRETKTLLTFKHMLFKYLLHSN